MTSLRIGTRRSALALAQARAVASALDDAGVATVLIEVTTRGDLDRSSPLSRIGGQGIFVGALRDALLGGDIDVAVHSLKDLPTQSVDGLVVAAVPEREDPRDVLVARDGLTLATLPPGARVGTGAPRRLAQLRLRGKDDLELVEIRGNVDTRIGKVASGELDAVVLARAGLGRLERLDEITETFDPTEFIPSPGQGALAVECRNADEGVVRALAGLDHPRTRAAVTAERAVLAALGAGCSAPMGAFADVDAGTDGSTLSLHAVVAAVDGSASVRLSTSGPLGEAEKLGRDLAAALLAEGASRLIEERVT
ncbi:MAG TPA: hydroxymethylbilane synthase [Actinopolymorphaceae bacterium]|nr:hydroxymethylbilane synthase [Actinopolymorphaceae bacterium]